jgi:hypothetical protein
MDAEGGVEKIVIGRTTKNAERRYISRYNAASIIETSKDHIVQCRTTFVPLLMRFVHALRATTLRMLAATPELAGKENSGQTHPTQWPAVRVYTASNEFSQTNSRKRSSSVVKLVGVAESTVDKVRDDASSSPSSSVAAGSTTYQISITLRREREPAKLIWRFRTEEEQAQFKTSELSSALGEVMSALEEKGEHTPRDPPIAYVGPVVKSMSIDKLSRNPHPR